MLNRQTSRFQSNNGGNRPNSHLIGTSVSVIQKHDQATGHLTSGTIAEILTNSSSHHRGIKVRLTDGTVGRISTATTTNGVGGSESSFPINDHHDDNQRQRENHTISDYIMPQTVLPNHQKRTANAVNMDTVTAICSQLISEFEGLTLSSSSSSSLKSASASSRKSDTTTKACVPSLQQFYRLGLILYRISKQHLRNNGSSRSNLGDLDPLGAYRNLIETIPHEILRSIFVDLRRATQTLLKSTLTRNNNNDNDNNGAIDDLGSAARSLAGLICCSFIYDDNNSSSSSSSSSSNNSRASCHLCYIIYDKAWISTLSALYDRFVIVQSRTSSSSSEIVNGNKNDLLSCLSQLLLDGLILPSTDNNINKVSMTTKTAEESLLEAIRAMEEESTDCLRDLQQWQGLYEPFRRSLETSIMNIGNKHDNNHENNNDNYVERAQQREYILSMLESARGQPSSTAVPSSSTMTNNKNNSTTKRSVVVPTPLSSSSTSSIGGTKQHNELDRRIQQVKQILPHFGEGFVEAALSLHRGDVEDTVATLLNHPTDNSNSSSSNSSYPAALRVLDPNLPRRKREFQTYRSVEEEKASAEQARLDVKERMALEEKQQQERYEALVVVTSQQPVELQDTEEADTTHGINNGKTKKQQQQQLKNEYDDDYDDQYDEVDIKLGTIDDGFTMDNDGMTFEQVKLYNQILREDESDSSFWEGARNTNRQRDGGRRRGGDGGGTNSRPSSRSNSPKKNGNHNNNNNNEKKFRGPNKIKGGRAIGADGKIIRNPGGGNNNNRNDIDNKNETSSRNNKSQAQPNKSNININNNDINNNKNNKKTSKPRTKPKSDNRVSRQRDRKQTKQGAFGVQS